MVRKSDEMPGSKDWNGFLRYASSEMLEIFSETRRHQTWRDLWIILAESEMALGLPIARSQVADLKKHRNRIDYEDVAKLEAELKHDVMAHLKSFGKQAKKAEPILHLGATSCDITDNADLIILRTALVVVLEKLYQVIRGLRDFSLKTRDIPTLGFTHFQVAQPVTVGKRAALWLQDFVMDFRELCFVLEHLHFRGVRGATGTQDSFLKLFNGDSRRVEKLERLVTKKAGFEDAFGVTGQTYPRKLDDLIVTALGNLAGSASKLSCDLRLLQHLDEMGEGFSKSQVGSSAMAFKQNPVKAERITSIARFLMTLSMNTKMTAAHQWLERTLDDSANRRLVLPQAFFAADALLELLGEILKAVQINRDVIRRNLRQWLPFLASETLLMEAVKRGGNRQALHEAIRRASVSARTRIRKGQEGDFLAELRKDKAFRFLNERILRPENFIGLCSQQVKRYCDEVTGVLNQLSRGHHLSQRRKLTGIRV